MPKSIQSQFKMLCSKPSSNWLDRLRSSKGFLLSSSPQPPDLDQFLSSTTTMVSADVIDQPLPPPQRQPLSTHRHVNIVLSDLFVMGGPPSLHQQSCKSSRKQSHPVPNRLAAASPTTDHSSTEPAKQKQNNDISSSYDKSLKKKKKKVPGQREKRRSKGPPSGDLAACSRTEVTVIDTSVPGWKSDKVIFRRGTVWKVRDRMVLTAWRKKRKLAGKGKEKKMEKEKALIDVDALDPDARNGDPVTFNDGEDLLNYKDGLLEAEHKSQLPRRRPKLLRSKHVQPSKDSSTALLKIKTSNARCEHLMQGAS